MANPEHLARLAEGVESWNAWRRENLSVEPDLMCGGFTWEEPLTFIRLAGTFESCLLCLFSG